MKLFKSTCFFSLLFIIIAVIFSTKVYADRAIINFDHLNVRTGPGTNFEKIKQVHMNEIYPIIQVQDEWVEIRLEKQKGWVMTKYITMEQENEIIENITTEQEISDVKKTDLPQNDINIKDELVFIQNDGTHIRRGPSVEDEIIFFAKKTDTFEIISENNDWYEVKLDKGTGYIFKRLVQQQINETNHLKGKTIVVDAGHGGHDVGSISVNGFFEKDFTLQSTLALQDILTMLGANVILTRENDDYIQLASRAALSNLYMADAFISIHYNSFPDNTSVSGIDTYYYDDHAQQFAQNIQQGIINETDASDRGIAFGDYQVIRQNLQPSVLAELGFLSNNSEEQLLLTGIYQKKLVKGIVTGLTKHFANDMNTSLKN